MTKIKAEIKKCEKKLKKLLALHEDGKQRWKLDRKGRRVELKISKTQGIIKGSKRHEKLLAHIEKLKSQV
jgi:ribosome-associated translation inhibitor RaiA